MRIAFNKYNHKHLTVSQHKV